MKLRLFYLIILAIFAIESAVSQNAEELPVQVETDNQFPPEHSELDGHIEDTDTPTTEPTQASESTITDEATSALTDENKESTLEITNSTPETSDGTTTSESTITDAAAQTTTTEQLENDDIDTTDAKSTDITSGSTIADETSTTNEQVTNSEGSETTVAEVAQTTTTSSDVAVPLLVAEDEQATTNEVSETTTTTTEAIEVITTVADDLITDNKAADTTQTTSGSTTVDIIVPTITAEVKPVANDEGTTTTGLETSEPTSGSTAADVVTSTLAKDEQTNSEGLETTISETSEPTSGSTVPDVAVPTLTTTVDLVTNDDISDTTVIEPTATAAFPCPKPCLCITEGDSNKYVVDCSGSDLSELPTEIDPKTTTLKLNNNKLTVIPTAISELKNLQVLNANDNLITELEYGSVSELQELVSLNLANNRFIEYPTDLENSLNKLEELDLAGNELKMTPEIFSNYKALRTVTLPEVSPELVAALCSSLKDTLTTVCTKSCEESSLKCSDAFIHTQHLLDVALPGTIPFIRGIDNEDTETSDNMPSKVVSSEKSNAEADSKVPPNPSTKENHITMAIPDISSTSETKDSSQSPLVPQQAGSGSKDNIPVNDFSLRSAVNNAPQEKVAVQSIVIDTPKESNDNDTDVKVGAKTTETAGGGGVDKSVIAVIVAGMVIIIAVITVKKNWSSIRKRFSSEPRPNDRSDRNANGTTPEEVPLQDKSPV